MAGRPSRRYIAADSKPLTNEQQQYVESVYGYCWHLARWGVGLLRRRKELTAARGDMSVDLFQSAVYGACIGARRFNPSRGVKPVTYLVPYCFHGVQDGLRQYAPIDPSFAWPTGHLRMDRQDGQAFISVLRDYLQTHDGEMGLLDAKSDRYTDDPLEDLIEQEQVASILKPLSSRNREIVYEHVVGGQELAAMAGRYRVTRQAVSSRFTKSMETLRQVTRRPTL